ncbi:hypothetical protein L6164_007969 [Bauhinia variegata]|uniref:Uncharacterized protein n=1 Tax=Bauhinia variegata TaxID=167791 RepID=A0ACB9PFD3_BAUVA|nr:hypothetical protein L6164_007969 [Bauhinia variegata]
MENRLKMRISRMFRSSFGSGSCRTRNLSDVMEKAAFAPENQSFHLLEPLSPKAHPFPSICRPKGSETSETIDHECAVSIKDSMPRRKVSEWPSPFVLSTLDGRSCPPATPTTPFNPILDKYYDFNEKVKNSRKCKKKKKKRNTQKKTKSREVFPFSSDAKDGNFGGYWWYSSDEDDEGEDETDTLFSSKSLSSDSSRSHRWHRSRRKNQSGNGVNSGNRSSTTGVMPLQGKVKDTFAVVKRSSDPYNDFRTSMVEMILEKQIFAPSELENLLQCFLSLNSHHHHKVIVEVFTEICEALFSDWFRN